MSPPPNRTLLRTLSLAALLVAGAAPAAEGLRPEDAIKLRRAAFALQGHYFSQLKPLAAGPQAFDARLAQRLTQRIELLSQMPPEFFPAGSGQGDTHARAAIWSDPKDFAAKQQQSIADLSKLAAAAQSENAETFRVQYFAAAASCKECHEIYRER